jgi:NAD(P)-dependent dehydrogenase (short-subunit alcohol dehydrogenase family)
MQRVLITGSNRGIGLAHCRALLARGARVFATCRNPDAAADLHALQAQHGDRLILVPLDVADQDSIDAAAAAVRQHTDALDLLINNAAINPPAVDQTLRGSSFDTLLDTLCINTAGPLQVTQALLDLVIAGDNPKIVTITSGLGSIETRRSGGNYAYSTSKAGLNMIARLMSFDLTPHGVIVITMDPGWVKTDMGGRGAELDPDESIRGQLNVIDNLTPDDSGHYFLYNGEEIPW